MNKRKLALNGAMALAAISFLAAVDSTLVSSLDWLRNWSYFGLLVGVGVALALATYHPKVNRENQNPSS